MKLVKYGIEEEESDIRAHVSLPGRALTIFRTVDMVKLIHSHAYREAAATQPGADGTTARGWLVPLKDIIPKYILKSEVFPWDDYNHDAMNLGQRGDMAVEVVKAAIRANQFPFWVCGIINSDIDLDIQGTDIIVHAQRHIQVKYDAKAYPSSDGGSGNLYIQTHEGNPRKIYGNLSASGEPVIKQPDNAHPSQTNQCTLPNDQSQATSNDSDLSVGEWFKSERIATEKKMLPKD